MTIVGTSVLALTGCVGQAAPAQTSSTTIEARHEAKYLQARDATEAVLSEAQREHQQAIDQCVEPPTETQSPQLQALQEVRRTG